MPTHGCFTSPRPRRRPRPAAPSPDGPPGLLTQLLRRAFPALPPVNVSCVLARARFRRQAWRSAGVGGASSWEPVLCDQIIEIIDPEQFAPRFALVSCGLLLDASQPTAVAGSPVRPRPQ